MSNDNPQIKVIGWPQEDSKNPSGWWVVESRKTGYTPLAGPFKTKTEAKAIKNNS